MSRRRAIARVNLAAIERNCAHLRAELREGCELCVVVKARGYGHGAVPSARAALQGGATRLAVAGSAEALQLRHAGLRDVPLMVMGALGELELGEALAADADVVLWREDQLDALIAAGGGRVHVKLDTGMGRLGTRDPQQATRVAERAAAESTVQLAGLMTHFATADDLNDSFFERQLEQFAEWVAPIKAAHPEVVVHAANSAAVLREPDAHFDMVRCGIAVYGLDPFGEDPWARGLEPALELASYVAEVKRFDAGESVGYGRQFIATHPTWLAVLPIGYGDGWRRGLSNNGEILIEGRPHPIVGTVSMDNLTVELSSLGEESSLGGGLVGRELSAGGKPSLGAEAVLIGSQGAARITAEQVARRLDTINYEIICGLTGRVPRVYHRDGEPLQEPDAQALAPIARRP